MVEKEKLNETARKNPYNHEVNDICTITPVDSVRLREYMAQSQRSANQISSSLFFLIIQLMIFDPQMAATDGTSCVSFFVSFAICFVAIKTLTPDKTRTRSIATEQEATPLHH